MDLVLTVATLKYLSGNGTSGTHKFYIGGSTLTSNGTLVMSIDSTGIDVTGTVEADFIQCNLRY